MPHGDGIRDRFELEVAAGPAAPARARLFVAAVLRMFGAAEQDVDDYKVVVSELVTAAASDPAARISIELANQHMRVSPLREGLLNKDSLARAVIEGFLPEFDLSVEEGTIRLPLPPLGSSET